MTLRAVKHYQKSMKHRFMTVFFIIFGIGLLNLLAFLSVSLSNTANIILSFIAPRGGFSPESGVFTLVNAVLILLFAVEARTYFRTKRFNNLFREKQNTERTAACFFMQELFLVFLDRDAAPRYIEDYTDNIMNARGFRAVPQELPPHLAHSFVNSTEFTEDFQYANFSEGDHNVRVLVYDSVMCYEYNDMFMFLNKFLKYEGGFYFVPKFGLSEKDLNFIRTVLKPKNVRSIKSGR
ncbi:MAG: hypothetical protein LBR54_03935, partial [Oscillospiraceae bacterium]|jgi:hypothetical protein|nr:hypothetical protein [Oscillospiraceae bacterium]